MLATLKKGRTLRKAFTASLDGRWHGAVPFPRSGFPTLRANAITAIENDFAGELP